MGTGALIAVILGLGLIAGLAGRWRAVRFGRAHSLPGYHGWFVAITMIMPALLFVALWSALSPILIDQSILTDRAIATALPADAFERASILNEARALATGALQGAFHPQAARLVPALAAARQFYAAAGTGIALTLMLIGGLWSFSQLRPGLRARNRVERIAMAGLLAAALIAVLTTIGIVTSLLFESIQFFRVVPASAFLFGTRWSPQAAGQGDVTAFGAVALFWGTIFIGAIIAMIIAIPIGLMTAIYLTQYAGGRVRAWIKPMLEILAGIPTVVYGYFAALTVAPAVRKFGIGLGIENATAESALAAGLVMGIMIIPFISSMADDALAAVPQSMRDGSLAMGATRSETIRRVLLPAALPGVAGGILLAVSRAIGETMIVVMAAGFAANLTANPFASVTTVTVQIVQLLTGEQSFDTPVALSAFALGLVLFIVTLLLNIVALRVVKAYREAYD
jgi:phosphate transport system permease protein